MSPSTSVDQIVRQSCESWTPSNKILNFATGSAIGRALVISTLIFAMSSYGSASYGLVTSDEELTDDFSEIRSPPPQIERISSLKTQHFSIGTGLAMSSGLSSSTAMLNIQSSYNRDLFPSITGKALANLSFGTGSDSSHFNVFAVGAEYLLGRLGSGSVHPYAGADLGYGIARNIQSVAGDGIVYSVFTEFRAQANATVFEIGFRYQLMANRLQDSRPRTMGIVAAVNL